MNNSDLSELGKTLKEYLNEMYSVVHSSSGQSYFNDAFNISFSNNFIIFTCGEDSITVYKEGSKVKIDIMISGVLEHLYNEKDPKILRTIVPIINEMISVNCEQEGLLFYTGKITRMFPVEVMGNEIIKVAFLTVKHFNEFFMTNKNFDNISSSIGITKKLLTTVKTGDLISGYVIKENERYIQQRLNFHKDPLCNSYTNNGFIPTVSSGKILIENFTIGDNQCLILH